MSVHEDLLNNGENNCSFTEDEVDIMCSKDGDDACGVRSVVVKSTEVNSVNSLKIEHFRVFGQPYVGCLDTRIFIFVWKE